MSAHQNQSKLECRPIRMKYFEISIDFYALTGQETETFKLSSSWGVWKLLARICLKIWKNTKNIDKFLLTIPLESTLYQNLDTLVK